MSKILVAYPAAVQSSNGEHYEARACGRERDDGRWEAWLELEPLRGGAEATIRTPAETTQPDRASLVAWARGISNVYLEGAIQRAVPSAVKGAARGATASGPAASPPQRSRSTTEPGPEGVLDPFEIYANGQSLLRRHLEALSVLHLRHIARAHEMSSASAVGRLTKEELVDLIVRETQRRASLEAARTT